ncbi:MAG: MFS transporter [Acidisphaera sp.]|nr:MFS transporter [Acidisphaera sp.]
MLRRAGADGYGGAGGLTLPAPRRHNRARATPTHTLTRTPRAASVAFILATIGIDALGIGIVIPVVPQLVRVLSGRDISGASVWVGALVATYAAAQFAAAPVLGGLSDRFGRRPVLLLSLAGVCANYLMLALAPSLAWLFLGRVLAGATAANISTANAYIADVTAPERRGQRFGLIGAMFGLGFVLGPALGGGLGSIALRLPFLAAAGLAGCNLLYGVFVLPESLPPERRRAFAWRRANPVGSLGALAADRAGAHLAVAWSCMWFGLGALQSSFVLSTALRFGWGAAQNGAALATVGIGQALVQGLLVRRVIARLDERRTALAGYLCNALAFLVLAAAWQGWMIYVGLLAQALGAVSIPSVRALLSARAGPERQGEMQGALASIEGLTAIVAPLVAATLFTLATRPGTALPFPGAPFLLAAGMYLLAHAAVRRA